MEPGPKKQYYSILDWIVSQGILNEKGEPFKYHNRPFLLDLLSDWTPQITVMACAQVGKSISFILKTLFAVKHLRFNLIVTFPTDEDVREFVASKVNKIIQSNRHEFSGMDSDSIERKEFDGRFIYFKGTVSKTAPISTTADVLVHDETSRSDQSALTTYKSRTKASPYKGRWLYSNPGTERDELDQSHLMSDQKEWFITCPSCQDQHSLQWPESIDIENQRYICRACKEPISDDVRRKGKWIDRDGVEWRGTLNPNYKISGWRISHLMCPDISVDEIISDSEGDPAYFNNFVLGKPYSPGDLSINKTTILDLWTPKDLVTPNIFLGVDVGNIKHYVIRSEKGLIKIGRFSQWTELDAIIQYWKPISGVIDSNPDNFAAKHYVATYPFMRMSTFMMNQNNPQTIVWWGKSSEPDTPANKQGVVYSHRDRILDQFLTHMIEARWLIGLKTDKDFYDYIRHFETLRREKVTDNKGIERYIWSSTTGEDHYCFVAGTRIATDKGDRNIETLRVGDRVLTRDGFKAIVFTDNRIAAVIHKGPLAGTPDHPVFVNSNKFKDLLAVSYRDRIYTWRPKLLVTKVLNFVDTLIQKIERNASISPLVQGTNGREYSVSTKRSTGIITDLFLSVLLYTIKTIIRSTINRPTWESYLRANTRHTTKLFGTRNIDQKIWHISEEFFPRCKKGVISGLKALKVSLKTALVPTNTYSLSLASSCVLSVKEKDRLLPEMEVSSVPRVVVHDGMPENGGEHIQAITERVYTLQIEDCHEYFANGILVSNCFADLYSYLAMLGEGSGTFFAEIVERQPIIDADSVYDVSRMFQENNE